MPLEFHGLGKISLAMDKLGDTDEMEDKVTRVMAEVLVEKAQPITPVLTGALQASYSVQKINEGHSVVMSTPYAAYQHEMSFIRRYPAENQWLVRAAVRYGDQILGAARDEMGRGISGALLARVAGSVIRGLYR